MRPGKYVVAVSGGVDSVVLLDVLRRQAGLTLVVAHFDHGMRADSSADAHFVQQLAQIQGLEFKSFKGKLGPKASEAAARTARYTFLRKVMAAEGATAIVTAHHQDDALETAIINLIRGTGRSGLTSLRSGKDIVRPLLALSKTEILRYAQDQHLDWREDSTNLDTSYLRNHVRLNVLPQLGPAGRAQLLQLIKSTQTINSELDSELANLLLLHASPKELNRQSFIMLAHPLAREALASWLRQNGIRDFDRTAIERLTVALKVLPAGKKVDVSGGYYITVGPKLALMHPER